MTLCTQEEPEPDNNNLPRPLGTSNDNIHRRLPAPQTPSIIEFLKDTAQFSKEVELGDNSAIAAERLRKSKEEVVFIKPTLR